MDDEYKKSSSSDPSAASKNRPELSRDERRRGSGYKGDGPGRGGNEAASAAILVAICICMHGTVQTLQANSNRPAVSSCLLVYR